MPAVNATGFPISGEYALSDRSCQLALCSISCPVDVHVDHSLEGSLTSFTCLKAWKGQMLHVGNLYPEHALVEHGRTCWVQIVFDAIAGSGDFYNSPVDPAVRSLMNIPFTIPSKPELEKTFITEAAARGLVRCPVSDARHVIRI